jgi:hypothetical protein
MTVTVADAELCAVTRNRHGKGFNCGGWGAALVGDIDVCDDAKVDLGDRHFDASHRDHLDIPDAGVRGAAIEPHGPHIAGIHDVLSEDVVAPFRVAHGRHEGLGKNVIADVVEVEVALIRQCRATDRGEEQ